VRPEELWNIVGDGKGVAGLGADEPVAAAHQLVFIAIDVESDELGDAE